MKHILILEDNEIYRKMLRKNLSQYGRVFEANNVSDGQKILQTLRVDLAFVDLDLNGKKLAGLEFLKKSKGTRSIILSSHSEEDIIEKAYDLGAEKFLNKWDFDEYLATTIKKLFLNTKIDPNDYYESLNVEFQKEIVATVANFEGSKDSLLVTGETGSGKGYFVKSLLRDKKFVHVNLSEFSRSTLESELFGHKKGSFTGAIEDKRGILRKADKGILFLDEIGTLDLEIQKKLLRVLEEGEFYPVGCDEPVKVDFRLICATCDDLSTMILNGKFREDFLYRINGIHLKIPSLSERPEDILHQIKVFNKTNVSKICFSKEAKELISLHSWKGNYRQLHSFFKRQQTVNNGLICREMIEQSLVENDEIDFLDTKMKAYIKTQGMGSFINKVEKEVVEWGKIMNRGALNKTIKMLGISKSLFYRIEKYQS